MEAGCRLAGPDGPDPYDWDLEQAVRSLHTLGGLKAEGANLWVAHDPQDWAAYGPLVPQS